jgi:hypothetical protein
MPDNNFGKFTLISQPKPDAAAILAASSGLRDNSDEMLRRARLLLRTLFNQYDGTVSETNAVADEVARLVVAEMRAVATEQIKSPTSHEPISGSSVAEVIR